MVRWSDGNGARRGWRDRGVPTGWGRRGLPWLLVALVAWGCRSAEEPIPEVIPDCPGPTTFPWPPREAMDAQGRVLFSGRAGFVPSPAGTPWIPAVIAEPLDPEDPNAIPIHALGCFQGARVADIGFGTGKITLRIAELVGTDGRVHAREIDARRVHDLQAKVSPRAMPQMDVGLSLPDDVRLPAGEVELVLLADVYQFIHGGHGARQDKYAFLASLREALVPHGIVVVVYYGTGAVVEARNAARILSWTLEDFVEAGFEPGRRFAFEDKGTHPAYVLEFRNPVE